MLCCEDRLYCADSVSDLFGQTVSVLSVDRLFQRCMDIEFQCCVDRLYCVDSVSDLFGQTASVLSEDTVSALYGQIISVLCGQIIVLTMFQTCLDRLLQY